jgi:hypothetical protein
MDDTNDIDLQNEKIEALLVEFTIHRDAIREMIVDLEKIRANIDRLIPDTLDARYVRFFEEKVKSITNLFNALLEMRKEIAKSAKDEIEIRRRVKNKIVDIDLDELFDIRSMVDKIDTLKDKTRKLRENRIEKNKEIEYDEFITIPGLNDEKENE